MKKLFAMMLALALILTSAVAFAHASDEIVHDGTLPATSEQSVKITIKALTDGSGDDPETRLPSEYHVRVIWSVQDGVYAATATDTEGPNGFQNFSWNCTTLDFVVNAVSGGDGQDIRSGNWLTKPAVAFEVTNASTPDLPIYAAASIKGTDNWAQFMKSNLISAQNSTLGTRMVPPVLKANLGTGVNSYEQGVGGPAGHNVMAHEYILDWDYSKLNQAALNAYKAGTGSADYTNTFVVTVSANAPTTAAQ